MEDELVVVGGQPSIHEVIRNGVRGTQAVVNSMGPFNVQQFRLYAVSWLVENNHLISEFESASFRALVQFASPEAERALWKSHNSVSTYIMRLYRTLHP